MNPKRVERLWRQEGLKVPVQISRNEGDCGLMTVPVFGYERLASEPRWWSYDFVHERTHEGRAFRLIDDPG